jgi:hypothetical protein
VPALSSPASAATALAPVPPSPRVKPAASAGQTAKAQDRGASKPVGTRTRLASADNPDPAAPAPSPPGEAPQAAPAAPVVAPAAPAHPQAAPAAAVVAPAAPAAPPAVDVDALLREAQQAWLKQHYAVAIARARAAIEIDPNRPLAYQIIGACSCALGEANEARQAASHLDAKKRKLVQTLCERNGVMLE